MSNLYETKTCPVCKEENRKFYSDSGLAASSKPSGGCQECAMKFVAADLRALHGLTSEWRQSLGEPIGYSHVRYTNG